MYHVLIYIHVIIIVFKLICVSSIRSIFIHLCSYYHKCNMYSASCREWILRFFIFIEIFTNVNDLKALFSHVMYSNHNLQHSSVESVWLYT